jgi:F-type H+-transporting ATPase subunit delta
MKSSKVAIRYAQALLDLAIENNNLESVSRDMSYLSQVNDENRDFQLLLSSPVINGDKKVAVLKEIFGAFEVVSTAFMVLITKNGRESLLPQIAAAYHELVKEKKGIVSVTIVSAAKLDGAVKQQIMDKIQATTKGTLEVTEEIDASLIGGFVVKMGDTQIDASVASKLAQLKQRLTR